MDIDGAKRIIEETDAFAGNGEKNVVMRGLQILAKYKEDVIPEFGHDIILVSDFEKTVRQMQEEEVIQMAKLGWFCREENDYWAHF